MDLITRKLYADKLDARVGKGQIIVLIGQWKSRSRLPPDGTVLLIPRNFF